MFRGLIDKRHNTKILTDKMTFSEYRGKGELIHGSGFVVRYSQFDTEYIVATIADPVQIHYERSRNNE